MLVKIDSKDNVRIVILFSSLNKEVYNIIRYTGQLGKKITRQPVICINKGKAKRSIYEQMNLELNSITNKYKDKGYKEIDYNINGFTELGIPIIDENEVRNLITDDMLLPTDTSGFKKHMLAKRISEIPKNVIDKVPYWYGSRKINGTRNSFYISLENGTIVSRSRGGKNYDIATTFFRENPVLIELFKEYPNIILDGELYKHGVSLQTISGIVRKEIPCKWLEYYIYDIMVESTTFEKRLEIINEISERFHFGFNPNRDWGDDELKIQIVPHEKVSGIDGIKALHDLYVKEGWEGLVIRDPFKEYKFGGRNAYMIKIKEYEEDEFTITGIVEKSRREDFCFTCVTKDNKPFNAKPIGSVALKEEYRKIIDSIIGKQGTVKYFEYSDEGIPQQPIFICVRDYE